MDKAFILWLEIGSGVGSLEQSWRTRKNVDCKQQ